VGAAATAATASSSAFFPEKINLPLGFQPEGIATVGTQFYVGSIPTGAIYHGNVVTGRGKVLVPPHAGRAAIGVDVERGQIFVAGGPTGNAFVYDARTGADVAAFDLASTTDTFINDVVVTKTAAWFTDSRQKVLYKVALGADGRATSGSQVTTVPLTGDIQYQTGFNVNGIDATPDGETLVIVQSNTGLLFTVAAATGASRTIDLGSENVANGDGILLRGKLLWVVQNQQNRIAKILLGSDLASGRVLTRLTHRQFSVPTTIDDVGRWLYAVNARFGTPPTPTTPYWLTRLRS
jgi:sugar lactone lactonase YvrE